MEYIKVHDLLAASPEEQARQVANLFSTVTQPLLPCDQYPDHSFGRGNGMAFGLSREWYIPEYGFVLLTQECVAALAQFLADKKTLEVGSGTGFLAHCLAEKGVDITALDHLPPDAGNTYRLAKTWRLDKHCSFEAELPGDYAAVILSWPNYESPFAHDVSRLMTVGQILVYQGESEGGCTADDSFFDYVNSPAWRELTDVTEKLNEYHRQFPGLHDRWAVYEKVS